MGQVTIRNAAVIGGLAFLAACSSHATTSAGDGAPIDAVRVGLPENEPMPGAVAGDGVAVWAGTPDSSVARFGVPGAAADLTVACRSGVLLVTRNVPAEVGAQALFALQGRSRILRLPVDATSIDGQRGYVWQGTLAADDPGTQVFEGAFFGTLPDAGKIVAPASAALRDVIARCRTRPATTAAVEATDSAAASAE